MSLPDTYVCVMFPYPSGAGLHLGHYYNYAVMDSYARWLRLKGEEVFTPFGYDAFGLPAELYARSVGRSPRDVTVENIQNFRVQMDRMNTQFEERLVTSESSFYRWSQWIFSELYKRDLAYQAEGEVNWCEACGTVLANEQAQGGTCERHGTPVEKRVMRQWYFRTTAYKDRLIAGLEGLDYPAGTIKQQREWLENLRDWCVSRQRSWGTPIPVDGETDTLDTFVDSSFYYLRYLTDSQQELIPAADYKQVDLYVGGPEHACMHLIYARFIHYFLYDIGVVPVEEPFKKVIHQGMITKDGAKMSKSKGNAVSPDEYDPDELRFYLMFLGHYFDGGDWNDQHIKGVRKFFARMKLWLAESGGDSLDTTHLEDHLDGYARSFKFNKVVSSFMEFYNRYKGKRLDEPTRARVIQMLQAFAPGFKL